MSAEHNIQVNISPEEQRRLEQERKQREMERTKLTAQCEELRLQQLRSNKVQNKLSEQQKQTTDLQNQTTQLSQKIQQCEANLQQSRQQLQQQITELTSLQGDVKQAKQGLQTAIQQGREALSQVDRTIKATKQQEEYLGQAQEEGNKVSQNISQMNNEIQKISDEIKFTNQNQSMQSMAMLTLQGMRENNYQLHEVRSRGDYIAYFEHAEEKHQIAVRMAPVKQLQSDTWDIVMETFGMEDESCCDELEDFTTAIEEIDGIEIRRGQFTYPKGARGGSLPEPSLQNNQQSRRKTQSRQRY